MMIVALVALALAVRRHKTKNYKINGEKTGTIKTNTKLWLNFLFACVIKQTLYELCDTRTMVHVVNVARICEYICVFDKYKLTHKHIHFTAYRAFVV